LDVSQGGRFLHSLLNVLWIQSNIRSILKSWCILMMRSRLQSEKEKDEVYDLLLNGQSSKTSSPQLRLIDGEGSEDAVDSTIAEARVVSPKVKARLQKQKTRLRRVVIVLAHLLIDRAQHGSTSLYFSWSVATSESSAIRGIGQTEEQPRSSSALTPIIAVLTICQGRASGHRGLWFCSC
jgi:hypothetical protein